MSQKMIRFMAIICIFLKTSLSAASGTEPSQNGTELSRNGTELSRNGTELHIKDIKQPPSSNDWVKFFALSSEQRELLWKNQQAKGVQTSEWDWQWRLAWIKSCEIAKASYCDRLLSSSLKDDKALVVRTEAVKVFGELYENSRDNKVITQLKTAYKNKSNYKNGKPMPIHREILYAIKRIGGEDASKAGEKLSKKHATLNEYWKKLNKM